MKQMEFSQIKKHIQQSSIGKKIIRAGVGRYKAWYQRVALYVTSLNFLMLFHNFSLQNDWFSWYVWLFVFIVCICSVLFVDILFVWESEVKTAAKKNPILMEMRNDIKLIKNKLGLDGE